MVEEPNIAAHAGRRSVYRVTSPSHEALVVLAGTMQDALGIVLEYQALRRLGEARITIDPGWSSTLSGVGRQHIEQAREMCRETSIATLYRADLGWALGGPELGLDES